LDALNPGIVPDFLAAGIGANDTTAMKGLPVNDNLKYGTICFGGDNPMQLTEEANATFGELTDEQRTAIKTVSASMRAYINAAKQLLDGKYKHLRAYAPAYLSEPCRVVAASCKNGVVVRYDKKGDESKIFSVWMDDDYRNIANLFSQRLIRCFDNSNSITRNEDPGTEVQLQTTNVATGQSSVAASFQVEFNIVIDQPMKWVLSRHSSDF
jgi:hypothetical protein